VAAKCIHIINYFFSIHMYKIDVITQVAKEERELLDVNLKVLGAIKDIDDSCFVLRMKVLNNVDFLLDNIMQEYESRDNK